jgi:hypothetical protein
VAFLCAARGDLPDRCAGQSATVRRVSDLAARSAAISPDILPESLAASGLPCLCRGDL